MYLCKNCGKDFDISEPRIDDVGYAFSVCPYCKGDDFSEAKRCPFSGAYIEVGESVAIEVYKDISKELDAIAESWGVSTDDTTEAFLDVLTAYIEGRTE